MTLEKDGITYELEDDVQIEAFLSCGWVEVNKLYEKPKAETKKTK